MLQKILSSFWKILFKSTYEFFVVFSMKKLQGCSLKIKSGNKHKKNIKGNIFFNE